MKRYVLIGAGVLAAILLVVLLAKGAKKTDPVTFTDGGVEAKVEYLESGPVQDRIRVTLNPVALDGRLAATATVEVTGDLTPVGPLRQPTALTRKGLPVQVYSASTAHLEVPVKRPSEKPGKVVVKVSYQACGKADCLPPVTGHTVTLDLK